MPDYSSYTIGTVLVGGVDRREVHLAAKVGDSVYRTVESLSTIVSTRAVKQIGRTATGGGGTTPFVKIANRTYTAGAGVRNTFRPVLEGFANEFEFNAYPSTPSYASPPYIDVTSNGVGVMVRVGNDVALRAYERRLRPNVGTPLYAIETTSPDRVLMVNNDGSSAVENVSENLSDKIEAVREEIRREVSEDVQRLKDAIGERAEAPAKSVQENPFPPTRVQVLTEAGGLINGDRDQVYGGDSMKAHERIGKLWGALLDLDDPIPPATVAVMMVGLKSLRAVSSPLHRDSYVDMAGYAGLGAEAAEYARDKAGA